MQDKALTTYAFTIDQAITEWLYRKKISKSGSEKTQKAYKDTITSLRETLQRGGLDLLSDPAQVSRVAAVWAAQRDPKSRRRGAIADSTYNQRLAIISSWYSFVKKVYELDIVNPVAQSRVEKRRVQAYASAEPLAADDVKGRLETIDRSTPQGMRDYVLLSIGLMTGRRASELTGMRWGDVKRRGLQTILEFRCKGGKIKRDALDGDTAKAFYVYLEVVHGKELSKLPADAPIWVSFSRENPGQAIGIKTLSNICRKALGTTKIHTLRHTWAKQMQYAGATLTEIQNGLGHEDIATTARYLKELSSEENVHAGKLAKRFGIARETS
jgi:site-specific recombinase XerD